MRLHPIGTPPGGDPTPRNAAYDVLRTPVYVA
jgi:hypothetical protein